MTSRFGSESVVQRSWKREQLSFFLLLVSSWVRSVFDKDTWSDEETKESAYRAFQRFVYYKGLNKLSICVVSADMEQNQIYNNQKSAWLVLFARPCLLLPQMHKKLKRSVQQEYSRRLCHWSYYCWYNIRSTILDWVVFFSARIVGKSDRRSVCLYRVTYHLASFVFLHYLNQPVVIWDPIKYSYI